MASEAKITPEPAARKCRVTRNSDRYPGAGIALIERRAGRAGARTVPE